MTATLRSLLVTSLLLPSLATADTIDTNEEPVYRCKKGDGMVTVTFKPETEVKDLVTWASGFTCKNFIYESRYVANKKVTIVAPAKLTPAEGYELFLVALSTAGVTVIPKGNNVWKVTEAQQARQGTVPIHKKGNLPANSDQLVRYVLRPSHVQADVMKQAIATVKSEAGDIATVGSILVITDYGSQVRDMMSLAALIDVPNGTEGVYTIPIKNADATKLAAKLEQFLGVTGSAAPAAPGKPGAGGESAAIVPSKLMVDERTNTIVVASSQAAYTRVKALVDRLDIALEVEGGSAFHVYPLGSAIAEELATTLNSAITGQQAATQAKQATTPKPGATAATPALDGVASTLEGPVRVIGDKPTNSLIVMSSGRDFLAIKDVIRQLDLPRRQVFIEALVLEVQMSDGLDVGTSSHGGLPVGEDAIGFGGVQAPSLKSMNLDSLATASGLIGGLIGGPLANSETLLGTSIPSYGILFQALANKSRTNIVQAPSIIALDNTEAKYKVGTNIPYKKGISIGGLTGESLPNSVGTNIERIDLQLELTIKPHISTNDDILLEVKHESRDLEGKDPELGATWNTRSFETRVLVRDQQTVVIGGLIQEREIENKSQVPLLGDIPILGHLFKYTSKSKQKTNLLVMLTPYVVKDQLDLQQLRERKMREHEEFVGSARSLAAMKYLPKMDYTRKRGLLEEINRTIQIVETDAAAVDKFRLKPPPTVESGPVEAGPVER